MQIVCTQADLRKALALVKRGVRESPDLPILSHVLLRASQGDVSLSANNLEIAIRCALRAEIREEGAIAVPWERLQDLVAHLPPVPGSKTTDMRADAMAIELAAAPDESTLSVHSGRSSATIRGMHVSEFPDVVVATSGEGSDVVALSLASSTLAAMVTRVAFAASTDSKRDPILTGVLVQVSGRSLLLAARDAHRLAVCQLSLSETVEAGCAVVIPARLALDAVRSLTTATPGLPVQLVIDEKRVLVSLHLPDFVLSSRLLVGDYPLGFQRHFHQAYAWRAVVATKHLAAALRSVASLVRDDGDLVTLSLGSAAGIGGRGVSVEARSQDLGEQVEEVETVSFEGESGVQLLLKLPQLAEIVGAADTAYLAFEVCAPSEPVVVRPVGERNALDSAYALVPCFRRT